MTTTSGQAVSEPATGSLAPEVASALGRAVARNARVFERMLDVAEARAAAGRYTSALEWCRLAAGHAVTNATGALRSSRLERVVDAVAEHTLVPTPRVPSAAAGRLRVLHVLSEAADIGGLTRLVERWIRRDGGSVSSVLTTRQAEAVPPLVAAVAVSGGVVHAFADRDAIGTAQRVREIVQAYDVVMCHLGVDDVVAAAAFGQGYAGPPVAVFNHTDHLFSVVGTRTTSIVDFRETGATLTREARGYDPGSMLRLPLLVPSMAEPVVPSMAEPGSGAVAPADLGFAEGAVVAITVARPTKYLDTAMRPTFTELMSRVLDESPELVLCAVGPSADEAPWAELQLRYGARIRAVGPVRDPAGYLAAADLYLDPFPFSSLTSLLEASSAALPVLTLDAHDGLRRALGIADFVAPAANRPTSVDAYADRLAELVRDDGERRRAGAAARQAYASMAPEDAWTEQVAELYRHLQARGRSGGVVSTGTPPDHDARLVEYGLAIQAVEANIPLLWRVLQRLSHLDGRDRVEVWARTFVVRSATKVATVLGAGPPRWLSGPPRWLSDPLRWLSLSKPRSRRGVVSTGSTTGVGGVVSTGSTTGGRGDGAELLLPVVVVPRSVEP